MPYYRQLGSIPKKRHTAHRTAPGYKGEGLFYEEVVTTGGFSRAYSTLYLLRPPTSIKKVEAAGTVRVAASPSPVWRHVHTLSVKMPRRGDPIPALVPDLPNESVTIYGHRTELSHAELDRLAPFD